MTPPVKPIVVFDAFGTLLDVHSAVARLSERLGPAAPRLSEIWRAKQLEYSWTRALMQRTAPFWKLTEEALDHALARCPEVDAGLRGDLLAAYRRLDAYPEVAETLARLRGRWARTAILSNGDPAMLADAVAAAGIAGALDAVISVEEAGTFKTHPDAYALISRRFEAAPEDVLFVSSNRWDIAGATAFGLACAWVNRTALPDEYPDLPPVARIADLSEIP
jgi:2-haloacid dehalogenase